MNKFIQFAFYLIVSFFLFFALHNLTDNFGKTQIKEITNLSISYSKDDPVGIMKDTKNAYKEPNKKIYNLKTE